MILWIGSDRFHIHMCAFHALKLAKNLNTTNGVASPSGLRTFVKTKTTINEMTRIPGDSIRSNQSYRYSFKFRKEYREIPDKF